MWLRYAKPLHPLKALRSSSRPPWLLLPLYSYSDSPEKKTKVTPLQETRMKDRFRIYVKGGDGGSGCSSVRRSRQDRAGKRDGGNGGRGGDVILECTPTVWDFRGLQPHIKAERGRQGSSKNQIGTPGEDKVVHVPIGTVIHLVKGEMPTMVEKRSSADLDPWELPGTLAANPLEEEDMPCATVKNHPSILTKVKSCYGNDGTVSRTEKTGGKSTNMLKSVQVKEGDDESDGDGMEEEIQYNVAELTEQGQRIIVARGAEGGLGSVCAPDPTRNPNLGKDEASFLDDGSSSRSGLTGSEAVLVLELKSIADVGLVGIPNAGKSTLLGALSRAKPRVGHYAFTTMRPNLGNMNFDDFSITVADIPGLIKGAHRNRGLGHAFLRHIERTKVLAYVVDLASGLDGRKGSPPWEQLRDLILELEYHQVGLSDRSSLVVANKIDETGAEEVYNELERRVKGVPIYPVCAVLDEGVPELKDGLRSLVNGGGDLQTLSLDDISFD